MLARAHPTARLLLVVLATSFAAAATRPHRITAVPRPAHAALHQVPDPAAQIPDLHVFVGRGCPHCARALAWVEDLRRRRPELTILVHDVVDEPDALQALRALSEQLGMAGVSVPTFVLRAQSVAVGFDAAETTGREIERALDEMETGGRVMGGAPSTALSPEAPSLRVPLLGEVALDDVGLPAFTMVIGLLDGFNPCAMWVLLFLISMLVHVQSRARMALVGGAFVAVSGIVYYAFMAAWLNAFLLLGVARWIQIGLAAVALLLGALNVKDFLWTGRGPSLGIPEAAKPGIYARVRRVVTAERLGAALGTVVALAFLVNLVELLCTAGLPALYTRILTLRDLSWLGYHAYLGLYIACYMLDDGLVLAIAIATLSHHRLQRGEARWLKLASGVVMLALGVLLLIEPAWLFGG